MLLSQFLNPTVSETLSVLPSSSAACSLPTRHRTIFLVFSQAVLPDYQWDIHDVRTLGWSTRSIKSVVTCVASLLHGSKRETLGMDYIVGILMGCIGTYQDHAVWVSWLDYPICTT